jgi:hypothetical protein
MRSRATFRRVETLIANCLAHGTIAILRKLVPRRLQKRLLKGALRGNSGTFSTFTPQSAHLRPHPEHSNLRLPRFRRTYNSKICPSMFWRQTR